MLYNAPRPLDDATAFQKNRIWPTRPCSENSESMLAENVEETIRETFEKKLSGIPAAPASSRLSGATCETLNRISDRRDLLTSESRRMDAQNRRFMFMRPPPREFLSLIELSHSFSAVSSFFFINVSSSSAAAVQRTTPAQLADSFNRPKNRKCVHFTPEVLHRSQNTAAL